MSIICIVFLFILLNILPIFILFLSFNIAKWHTKYLFNIIDKSNLSDHDKGLCSISLIDVSRKSRGFYQAIAPILLLYVLPFVSRSSTQLPSWLSMFDNDEGLNGNLEHNMGFSPNSFVARWIWIGWRNRAVRADYLNGVKQTEKSQVADGDPLTSEDHAGYCIVKAGELFKIFTSQKWWIFCIRRHYGWKLDQPWKMNGEYQGIVRPVTIGWSIRKWKGK